MKLLWGELVVYKDILKPRMDRDIGWLVQSRTTKTLLWQLLVIYPLGTQGLAYLITHHIILLRNLTYIYKLLPVVSGDLFFITPILCLFLNILALLPYQALLVGLLGIIGGVDSHGIVVNLIQLFQISAKKGLGDIVVKDIKGMLLFRLRLLKSLKAVIKLSKDKNLP